VIAGTDVLLFVWAVTFTVLYLNLRRRTKGIDDPVMVLPRRERRKHARELLQRESDEYHQRVFEQATAFIQKGNQ
jgi:hypothetical protein